MASKNKGNKTHFETLDQSTMLAAFKITSNVCFYF